MTDSGVAGKGGRESPPTGDEYDVFISHARVDEAWAWWLARTLRDAGLSVWLASDELRVGDHLTDRISDALERSRYVLALASDQALESGWVRRELDMAVSLGKSVFWARVEAGVAAPPTGAAVVDLAGRSLPEAAEVVVRLLTEESAATSALDLPTGRGVVDLDRYVERPQEEAALRAAFSRAKSSGVPAMVVLYGPARSGKTTLAARFAEENAGEFSDVLWWRSTPADRLDSLAERLAPGMLVIADDVEDIAGIARVVRSRGAHLLVLVRKASLAGALPPEVERVATHISSERFTIDQSIRLLAALLPELPRQEAMEIAQAMGGFPLGLEIAAELVRARSMEPGALLELIAALNEASTARPRRGFYYLDTDDPRAIAEFERSLVQLLAGADRRPVDLLPPEVGSWTSWWRDRYSPDQVERLADKAERAAEVLALSKPEGEANLAHAEAVARLLESSLAIPNIVVNAGSVLLIKITDERGPRVYTKTLTATEMRRFEDNQQLLANPERALELLGLLAPGREPPPALQ